MCNPMLLMVASTAVTTVGAMQQAQAQRDSYAYQSKVAANNATMSEQQAKLAIEQGQQEEQNQRLKVASMFGDQRAQLAANGIDLGEGSATDLLATTKYMGNRDALTIRDNASRSAWGYRVQKQNFLDDAAAKRATADSINPLMAGATSLLGSASGVANAWYTAKKTGVDLNKPFWK